MNTKFAYPEASLLLIAQVRILIEPILAEKYRPFTQRSGKTNRLLIGCAIPTDFVVEALLALLCWHVFIRSS